MFPNLPKRVSCCECWHERKGMRPVVKHADGWIDYVCPVCWEKFDYQMFWFKEPKDVN